MTRKDNHIDKTLDIYKKFYLFNGFQFLDTGTG